ncbi:MAG: 50S ribosomal protein L29 [Candidatus Eisenbacteria bacterium]|nr:50S ribosomal protein L29 [Candidatus Eisenbacteria bacterium]
MPRELNVERVRSMDEDDIAARIKGLEEALFNLRFRNAMKQLENPLEIRNLRRDLARLKTILSEHRSGLRPLGA